MTTLRELIEAVEENNDINDSTWAGWDDADHILSTYGGDYSDDDVPWSDAERILNAAIRSDGMSLAVDLPKLERRVWGQNFAGSFYDYTPYVLEWREEAGLSRAELARRLPVAYRTLEDWEAGKAVPPAYLKRALRDLKREFAE